MRAIIKNKKWLLVIIIIVFFFIMYNVFWFCWRNARYNGYTDNLDTFREHYSYVLTAEDGYLYNVKLPDYLSFTGNLCVATPDGRVALIIWPKIFRGYSYGVQIEKDGEIYSIELNEDLKSNQSEYNNLVGENQDTVSLLMEKAENMWEKMKQY